MPKILNLPQSALVRVPIMLIGLFAFMQVYSIQAVLPLLLAQLHASPEEGGLAVGATVLGMALLSPLVGMLSDRFGRKIMIVSALGLLAVPCYFMAQVESMQALSAWRLLQGLLVPAMTITLIAYIGEEFEREEVGRLMAVYVMGTVLGGFFGRFMLGHLSALFSLKSAFYTMAALCVLGVVVVMFTLPPSKRFVPQTKFHETQAALRSHMKNPALRAACALGFCVLFSLVGCFTFINLHLAAPPYHFTSATLANIFAVYLIGMVITPVSGLLMRRLGMQQSALVAILTSMLGLLLTLNASFPLILLGLILMCSGVFIVQSCTISHIALNVSYGRSLASGLYYTAYYLGGTIGAWVCGHAYSWGGWGAVVALVLLVQTKALWIAGRSMA